MARPVRLNGIEYAWPSRPVAVVCVDGGDPEYFERGLRDGILPNVARFVREGFATVADGTVPSFTCPNNLSIVTGAPASVHGISGNFFLDARTGEAVAMTGRPNVVFLQDLLDARFGAGTTRVICPVTDAYVRHHGALGGFVWIWRVGDTVGVADLLAFVGAVPGAAEALDRDTACTRFSLPPDREGDVAVIVARHVAIGASGRDHDLSALGGERLRSHGGTTEARAPFILSEPLGPQYLSRGAGRLDSWRIFEFALNGTH